MKICIAGAGAIGGFIGARLAATGEHAISAVARGETLAALQTHGFRLDEGDTRIQGPVTARADAVELGVQDLLIVAVKGQSLSSLAPSLAPLIGPQTIVLPAMNGVPWWFAQTIAELNGQPLSSVDPGGVISQHIPFSNVLGGVVHASTSVSEPGVVRHKMGKGLIIGEPSGGMSPRVGAVADALRRAGFDVNASERIRFDIWYKLWGNMTMNPVSALTGATIDRLLGDDLVREFCSRAMLEAAAIGAKIGCGVDQLPDDRHQVTLKLGAFKTSMLQDAEAGRSIELDGLVTVVREIGAAVAVPTPTIDAILGLTRLYGRSHGLYPN
jgi:2-dehydropantoate 2-reductase